MLTLIPGGLGNAVIDRLWRDLMSMDPTLTNAASNARPAAAVPGARRSSGWPAMNVWRDGDRIVAEAEVPGFRMDDIELLATDDTLTLRGQRQADAPAGGEEEGERPVPLRIERSVQTFERSLRLPVPIDPEHVEATLNDGVLRVTLPLAQNARPRRIEIRPTNALANQSCTQISSQPA